MRDGATDAGALQRAEDLGEGGQVGRVGDELALVEKGLRSSRARFERATICAARGQQTQLVLRDQPLGAESQKRWLEGS